MKLRNKISAASAIVLMLAGWGQNSTAQERISGGMNDNPDYQGGRVIEVGEDEPMQGDIAVQAEQVTVPVQQTGPGIEMIIGGQGTGGIAKKGTLPVVD